MEQRLKDLKKFLDEKVELFNRPAFIECDPISIPHQFTNKQDIEIAGFLAATIAWGNRTSILKNARRMLAFMGESPCDFIMSHNEHDLKKAEGFVHRTFNSDDLLAFIEGLKHLYRDGNGLEGIFEKYQTEDSLQPAIHELKKEFFVGPHLERSRKHISDPMTGSAAKRINIFLRMIKVA